MSPENLVPPAISASGIPPRSPPPAESYVERPSDIADLPRASRDDFIERAWRFFCSTKLMVVLMALFALGMAGSSFINPKKDALADIEKSFVAHPHIIWAYKAFELYAPYKSWWFTSIILLLALNNLASSLERLPRIYLIVRHPQRLLTDLVLRGLRNKRTVPRGQLTPDGVELGMVSAGYKTTRTVEGDVTYLFGERGAWTRFGVWVVHLALLVICFGGILGRLFAFEGTMLIPANGGIRSSFAETLPDGTVLDHPLPGFAIKCDHFYLDKFKDGSARRYASDLEVLDANFKSIYKKKIIVNDPLVWDGMKFYQATFSERPDESEALLTLTDQKTGQSKEIHATANHPFAFGNSPVRFEVAEYRDSFGELGPAIHIEREEAPPGVTPTQDNIKASSFWVFQNYPNFDAKYRGGRYAIKFKKLVPSYFTGIQVARDPGFKIIIMGAVLMWIGLFITFWTAHRRVWARIEGEKVTFAGAAHRNKERFREQFDTLIDRLTGQTADRKST